MTLNNAANSRSMSQLYGGNLEIEVSATSKR